MTLQQKLQYLYSEITSKDAERQFTAISFLRKQFLANDDSQIQNVIDYGFVSILVQLLSSSNQKIQYESLCSLTNITSGTLQQKKYVVNNGAVSNIIELLESPFNEVKEQAVWILGNTASDCVEHRDLLINSDILKKLLPILAETQVVEILRKATRTLANLCKGNPKPSFVKLKPALPILSRLLYDDTEVILQACVALSMLSDGPYEQIQAVIECGPSRRLVELLMHADSSIQHAALTTVGNICSGSDLQAQIIINVCALPCLFALLRKPNQDMVKKVCWTISNITAGNINQIQAVIDARMVPALVSILNSEKDLDIKHEALRAISNALTGASSEQVMDLINEGCIKPVCDMLGSKQEKSIELALQGLENILMCEHNYNSDYPTDLIEESGGFDMIDKLQSYQKNKQIQRLAISLAKKCSMYSCDEG